MSNNIYGIDFGTCNFKVFSKSSGKVVSEKNTIAIINKTQIYAYGDDAYAMYEKAPESINVTFPVSTGVIADYNFLQTMIFDYIEKKLKGRVKNAEFLVAVPTDITDVEKRAFFELFYKSKFRPKNVMLCEKPLADAVGLGIDVNQPTGVMVVDMGADTIEISVISLGGLVLSDLMHFGSNRLDESIISYIRREFNLVIGKKTAKALKEELGSGLPGRQETMTVVGLDVVSGLPVEREIPTKMVDESLEEHFNTIIDNVKVILERTPPELAADIYRHGIYLTGGASQVNHLAERLATGTGLHVNVAENPLTSVAMGLAKIIKDDNYKSVAYAIEGMSK